MPLQTFCIDEFNWIVVIAKTVQSIYALFSLLKENYLKYIVMPHHRPISIFDLTNTNENHVDPNFIMSLFINFNVMKLHKPSDFF